jgi:hypothetical protein
MRPVRNWNDYSGIGKPSPYPQLDSLSISQDQEHKYELQADKGSNYKPLVALNIDIGEPTPVKIFVYDFTDPWKRAYEFLQAYDLPEEMHEDIAMLIANAKEAKEKELKMQRLALEKEKAMACLRQGKADGPNMDNRRRTSCELRSSNSASKFIQLEPVKKTPKEIFGNVNGPHNPFRKQTLERNRSIDLYSKTQCTQSGGGRGFSKGCFELESRGVVRESSEKSNILDSTTLLSSTTDKQRASVGESPFESKLCDLTDLEYSTMRPTHVSAKRQPADGDDSRPDSLLACPLDGPSPPPGKAGVAERKEHESVIRQLFSRLDYECGGTVRSYDVYLSDLPSETKNILQAVLSRYDEKDSFKAFDLDSFRAAVLSSADFSSIKLTN